MFETKEWLLGLGSNETKSIFEVKLSDGVGFGGRGDVRGEQSGAGARD